MRNFVVECWNGVMNFNHNPLKNIPDLKVRHLILQILAWMWCITFAIIVGSCNTLEEATSNLFARFSLATVDK